MAVLLLAFATAMAVGTFVENDYGTPTAKALVYNTFWFEMIMLLLILNFMGNIWRYRLWTRQKLPVLVFHLSFIFLFIGGAITRYISFEGTMLIREGKTSNEILSGNQYFKIQIEEKGDVLSYEDVPYLMSPLHKDFQGNYDFHGKKVQVKAVAYVQRKKDSLVASPTGEKYLHLVSTGDNGRVNYYLKSGESKSLGGMLVAYNRDIPGAVVFNDTAGPLQIRTPVAAQFMTMATQATGTTAAEQFQPLVLRSLYTIGELRLVVPEPVRTGILKQYEGDKKKDAALPDELTVELTGPSGTKSLVKLPVVKGDPNQFKQVAIDGLQIILGFGPKVINTPFAVRLDDFVMETYPGSNAPSSYESKVTVIDQGKAMPHKIYMNHVLDYGGYRFFQSGFDPDRQGTQLSVNHDAWGTAITYIGYFLLFTSMFMIFFWKGTHFNKLATQLKNIKTKSALALLFLLAMMNVFGQKIETHGTDDGSGTHQHTPAAPANETANTTQTARPMMREISIDEAVHRTKINAEHAEKFGYLLVQNAEGRIVPIDTQALDVLRKLHKGDALKASDGQKLTADQFFLAANTDPATWAMVPMIKITLGGDLLMKKVKGNADGYTSLMNLFPVDAQGNMQYVLEKDYQEAFAKKPADQSKYDQAVIDLNDRVQAFNGLFGGQYLRVVPLKNDPNHTWSSYVQPDMEPNLEAQQILAPYFISVMDAARTGNWDTANAELKKLQDYQKVWGKSVIPDERKVEVEVFMNRLNINFLLLIFYSIIGCFLAVLAFFQLFRPNRIISLVVKGLLIIAGIGWFLQLLGLVGRWYVSGHAPWSNGYEAIIFISWVAITAGFALYKNSNALVPAAGVLVAVIMMGFAHGGSALDPQITPLVPVLKSYWLVVHVAIITSSYGFFGLSFIIAVISLLFYILAGKKTYLFHKNTTLRELAIVSEMSLTIGLYALTVGTFLGGIWANESWGRYWSWDPKETWALISVMVYAFVIHMRLVPGLRSRWAFHTAAMFAISSIIMTYFGVNYYLSGLHSYAAGDPVPIPLWVYLGTAGMILLSTLSYFRQKRLNS